MKKFLFLLSFLTIGALTTVNAQSEKKACKKSAKCCAKKATASTDADTKVMGVSTNSTKPAACASKKKACCAKSGKTAVAGVVMTASDAAKADESVEERVCAKSGSTSYYQKAECPISGKVTYSQVEFDEASAKFVNLAPSDMKSEKKACDKKSTTCTKKVQAAKVVKTSIKE